MLWSKNTTKFRTLQCSDTVLFGSCITIEERKAVIITRQKKYYTNKKLSYWKEKLKDYDYFAQPHYSYLVNLRYVSDFNKTQLNIKVDLKTETLPISQRNYSNFKKAYFAYIGV